jgi:hypothetical protein
MKLCAREPVDLCVALHGYTVQSLSALDVFPLSSSAWKYAHVRIVPTNRLTSYISLILHYFLLLVRNDIDTVNGAHCGMPSLRPAAVRGRERQTAR